MPFTAALFDLDGVIISTDILHYRSWEVLTREQGIPFSWEINKRLLGVSRMQSLEIVLELASKSYTDQEKQALADRKNAHYLQMVQQLTHDDLLPGALPFISELRARGVRTAVCSGSRNAKVIVGQLQLTPLFDLIIDGNDITRTKPDPQIFLMAAERLGVSPANCLVIEDAEVGVEAARRAGMRSLGIGDTKRLQAADLAAESISGISVEAVWELFDTGRTAGATG